tara:strand:+ start:4396 stop:5559 length:1164 start_codon:yes stop_codon:yes gene_type:complete
MEIKYFVEQINVSDDEYKIVEMNHKNGTFVKKNEEIFSYESSKTVHEAVAEADGYLYFNPSCKLDENFNIGYQVATQTSEEIKDVDLFDRFNSVKDIINTDNKDFKVSKKAQILIEKYDLSVSNFSEYEIISEQVVNDYINTLSPQINNLETFSAKGSELAFFSSEQNSSKKSVKLAVIGAGKAALQLYDSLIDSSEYEITNFYDSDSSKIQTKLFGINIIYGDLVKNITKDFEDNVFDECIISFSGNIDARKLLFLALKKKDIKFANIIHKSAYISKLSIIGEGNIIFANVRLAPFCSLGNNNVLSASCSIEHNNIIGNHNTFGPGVLFSGSCTIGDTNKFGTMIGVEPNVKIGSNNIIASSQVISTKLGDSKLIRSKASSEIKDI